MGRPAILKVDIIADAKGVGKGVGEAESRFGRLGSMAGKVGKAAGLGLAAAGAAAVGMAVSSVKSASQVEQAYGALDSVFGRNGKTVKSWAEGAADSVGLAKGEYADLAAVIGSQLNNMGRSQAQSAAQTRQLISLGADMAATYGGTTRDAVEALSSALKGETDPIERYGVSIKQSDINARLAAQGLGHLTGTAGKQAQASAVLGLITKQTTAAHGQFAAQADTLAERQQILTAKWENAKATLGQRLLPAATAAAGFFLNRFLPAASSLAHTIGDRLGPTITSTGRFITGTLVPAGQRLFAFFMSDLVPAIRAYVSPILAGLRSAFHSVSSSVDDNSGNLSKLAHFLGEVVPPVARVLAKVLGGSLGLQFRIIGGVIGGVITTIATLVGWIDTAVGKLRSLGSAVKGAAGFLGKVAGVLGHTAVDGMVAGPLAIGQPALAQPGTGPLMASWATAAAAGGGGGFYSPARTGAGGGVTYVDRRSFTATVESVLADPVGTARAIQQLLDDHAARTGLSAARWVPAS